MIEFFQRLLNLDSTKADSCSRRKTTCIFSCDCIFWQCRNTTKVMWEFTTCTLKPDHSGYIVPKITNIISSALLGDIFATPGSCRFVHRKYFFYFQNDYWNLSYYLTTAYRTYLCRLRDSFTSRNDKLTGLFQRFTIRMFSDDVFSSKKLQRPTRRTLMNGGMVLASVAVKSCQQNNKLLAILCCVDRRHQLAERSCCRTARSAAEWPLQYTTLPVDEHNIVKY